MRTSEIFQGIKKQFSVDSLELKLDSFSKQIIENSVIYRRGETIKDFPLLKRYGDMYQDIITSTVYEETEMDILVPFTRMFPRKNHLTKKQAIKLYNAKMFEKLPVKNLVLGNISIITSQIREDSRDEVKISLKCYPIKNKALLLKSSDNYIDLETHIAYPINNFGEKDIIVTREEPIYKEIELPSPEASIEYYKILSKYRKINKWKR